MPIYAYKCASCGHAKDVLQKMSDAPLSVCPACGAPTFSKQVTAAGFQLKGSGWYVTDFKSGNQPKPNGDADAKKDGESSGGSDKPASDTKPASEAGNSNGANANNAASSDAKPAAKSDIKPAPAPAAASKAAKPPTAAGGG